MSQSQRPPMHTCHFLRDGPCGACEAAQRGLRAVQQQLMEARRFLDREAASGNMQPVKLDDDWLRLIAAAIAYGRGHDNAQETQDRSLGEGPLADDHARFGFIELEASGADLSTDISTERP